MFPLIFMLLIVFYLMVLRPQKKEQKKRLELLNNLKKNDRVVTIGGIYGVVMNAKREADEVILKVDEIERHENPRNVQRHRPGHYR